MKNITATHLILSSLMTSIQPALAEEIPLLDTAIPIDHFIAFESTDANLLYLPTSFKAGLKCSNNSTSSYCTLNIYNSLTQKSIESIESLSQKSSVIPLRADIYDSTIFGVNESLDGKIMQYLNGPKSFMSLKTFALMSAPYGSSTFKASLNEGNDLVNAFQNEGIGSFIANYTIRGVKTYEHLQIESSNQLLKSLQQLNRPLSYVDLKKWVKINLSAVIKFKNIDIDEALILVSRFIKTTFMHRTQNGSLELDRNKLSQFQAKGKASIRILNETSDSMTISCKTTLDLKENSISQTQCEDIP